MQKIIIGLAACVALACVPALSSAQSTTESLEVLCGPVKPFVQKLVERGYTESTAARDLVLVNESEVRLVQLNNPIAGTFAIVIGNAVQACLIGVGAEAQL